MGGHHLGYLCESPTLIVSERLSEEGVHFNEIATGQASQATTVGACQHDKLGPRPSWWI